MRRGHAGLGAAAQGRARPGRARQGCAGTRARECVTAGLSRAHFSREFRRAFGESPHTYLLTRRLECAAVLLRSTDRSVADICFSVGLQSVGSFTTSFTRNYGVSPTAYRATFPPAAQHALIPACVLHACGRPQRRTSREARDAVRD
ncbi:MAG: helix-turn-helix transcriptional regulator [Solirubrobacteraceae bacterium]